MRSGSADLTSGERLYRWIAAASDAPAGSWTTLMSVEGAEVVVAPRFAERARVAAAGAACRHTTTTLPGTVGTPPVFHGSFAACVSNARCVGTCALRIDGAPVAACDEAASVVARRVVRARQ